MNESKRPATEEDITDLAARMYQSSDLIMEIENGEFSSLDELLAYLKNTSGRMNRTIEKLKAGETAGGRS